MEPKTVWITGGASGIGQGLAQCYARRGCNLVLIDRHSPADVAAALSSQTGAVVRAVTLDVSAADAVAETFLDLSAKAAPDLIINSAGVALARPFDSTTMADFEQIIRINLLGSVAVAKAGLPLLKPAGQLVLVASLAGLMGGYGYSAYSASKYGVVGFAEVLRVELASTGIQVSVVCPPEVDTPMVQQERLERPKVTEAMKLLAGTLSVDAACHQILAGIDARRFLIVPGARARSLLLSNRLLPRLLTQWFADRLVRRSMID